MSLLEKALYEKEEVVNPTERRVIEEISALENVKCWHRNNENSGFFINGFINHYPDYIVFTNKGNVIMVEVKGDDRTNLDSERKMILGGKWADMSGGKFQYYMVFDNVKWEKEGAYVLPKFIDLLKQM